MSFEEAMQMYSDMLHHTTARTAARAVGEPRNDGPEVRVLLDCARDLARNYSPTGAIRIVDLE